MTVVRAEAAAKIPSSENQSRLHRLYARCEKLLGQTEKRGDTRAATALLSQLDSLGDKIALAESRKGAKRADQQPLIRITFDSPDPNVKGSADVWENLRYALQHYGAPKLLAMTLKTMYDDGKFNERVKAAAFSFLGTLEAEEGFDADEEEETFAE